MSLIQQLNYLKNETRHIVLFPENQVNISELHRIFHDVYHTNGFIGDSSAKSRHLLLQKEVADLLNANVLAYLFLDPEGKKNSIQLGPVDNSASEVPRPAENQDLNSQQTIENNTTLTFQEIICKGFGDDETLISSMINLKSDYKVESLAIIQEQYSANTTRIIQAILSIYEELEDLKDFPYIEYQRMAAEHWYYYLIHQSAAQYQTLIARQNSLFTFNTSVHSLPKHIKSKIRNAWDDGRNALRKHKKEHPKDCDIVKLTNVFSEAFAYSLNNSFNITLIPYFYGYPYLSSTENSPTSPVPSLLEEKVENPSKVDKKKICFEKDFISTVDVMSTYKNLSFNNLLSALNLTFMQLLGYNDINKRNFQTKFTTSTFDISCLSAEEQLKYLKDPSIVLKIPTSLVRKREYFLKLHNSLSIFFMDYINLLDVHRLMNEQMIDNDSSISLQELEKSFDARFSLVAIKDEKLLGFLIASCKDNTVKINLTGEIVESDIVSRLETKLMESYLPKKTMSSEMEYQQFLAITRDENNFRQIVWNKNLISYSWPSTTSLAKNRNCTWRPVARDWDTVTSELEAKSSEPMGFGA